MTDRRKLLLAVVAVAGLGLHAGVVRADTSGTADQAHALLLRAAAAVKVDKPGALAKFIKGEDGFRQGDLYVFCAVPNGTVVAHPNRLGDNLYEQADKNGRLFGQEIMSTAKEGAVSLISYMWPRPGTQAPVQKQTYYTKVDGLVCGVGYYP